MISVFTVLFVNNARTETPNIDGLLVHVVNPVSSVNILPTTFPLPGSSSKTIKITACRGEFEPASFVIRPVENDVSNLLLIPTDLKSESATISSRYVDIKIVKVWYQGGSAWNNIRANKEPILVPELLLNDDDLIKVDSVNQTNYLKLLTASGQRFVSISNPKPADESPLILDVAEYPVKDSPALQPLSIPANSNKQFWITIKVPDEATSGLYKGVIHIKEKGRLIGTLNMELNVLPFTLEKPEIEYSIYYRGQLVDGRGSISSEYKNETQFKAELLNLVEHGVRNPTVYQPLKDRVLLKRALALRQQVGISGSPLYYLGIKTENPGNAYALATYEKQINEMIQLIKPFGITDLYVYGVDEADQQMLLKQKQTWNFVHQLGAKVFAAGWKSGHFELIGDIVDLFIDGYIPRRSESEKFHQAGHRIFSYNQPQVGVENPLVYRKNYGIRLWQLKYDGAMNYAYQHGFGSIWNDFDHPKFRDHCFTYPTVDGVIDTIAWEGFREGVDDVRYITALEKKIDEAHKSGNFQKAQFAKDAESYLESIKTYSGDDLVTVRQQIVDRILKIDAAH